MCSIPTASVVLRLDLIPDPIHGLQIRVLRAQILLSEPGLQLLKTVDELLIGAVQSQGRVDFHQSGHVDHGEQQISQLLFDALWIAMVLRVPQLLNFL